MQAALPPAERADPALGRFAGTHLLAHLHLVAANKALLSVLDDPDLRILAHVVAGLRGQVDETLTKNDLFERLELALPRFPKQQTVLKPIIWPWLTLPADLAIAASLMFDCLGERSPHRLAPHLSAMNPYDRGRLVKLLAKPKHWDDETRNVLFSLVGDPSSDVRAAALNAISHCSVEEPEVIGFERMLTRKASDLRRGLISVLLNQHDEGVLASAERQLSASDSRQRLAGLELLRESFRHPVLAPMLRGLVFVSEDAMGYPIERGLALESHLGTMSAVGASEHLASPTVVTS